MEQVMGDLVLSSSLLALKVSVLIHLLQLQEQVQVEHVRYEARADSGQLRETQAVYLTPMYYSEVGVAQRLRKISDARLTTGVTRTDGTVNTGASRRMELPGRSVRVKKV